MVGSQVLESVWFTLKWWFSNLSLYPNHLEALLKPRGLRPTSRASNAWVWDGAREFAFLINSQGMLTLLADGEHKGEG